MLYPKQYRILVTMVFAAILGSLSTIHAQEDSAGDEIFELSPFSIEAEDDRGYRATNTLAGSRVRTNLRDLGASIALLTDEFMEDIGATDGESLLSNVGNMEVGGVLGNFSNASPLDGSTNISRINPHQSQRVRGLVEAVLTRDYFQTDIPFDTYNTSRVTINRGPNSILFGLGSPGGVINNTTSKAMIGSNLGKFSFRFDHRGGHRETIDYSKTLINGRLAIRFAALNEEIEFKQEPAFEDDRRLYIAWDAALLENKNSRILGKTTFRGSFEDGEIVRNPPDTVPPGDGFSSWFVGLGDQENVNRVLSVPGVGLNNIKEAALTQQQVLNAINAGIAIVPDNFPGTPEQYATREGRFIPKTLIDRFKRGDITSGNGGQDFVVGITPYFIYPSINFNSGQAGTEPGWNSPELAGIQGIMGRWRPNGFITQDVRWTFPATVGIPGFLAQSIQNREVFDYQNRLFQGTTNLVQTDFDIRQFVLEQSLFGGNAGFEIAYDKQHSEQERFTPFSSGSSKFVAIDITTHHPPADENFDGIADRTPNENVGRPVARWQDPLKSREWNDQETLRATLFGSVDFKELLDSQMGSLFGTHRVTGLLENRTNDTSLRQTRGAWWADTGDYPGETFISRGDNNNFRRVVESQIYLGPDTRGLSSPDDVRITDSLNLRLPQFGDEFGIWYFDNRNSVDQGVKNNWRIIEALASADLSRTKLESRAVSLQSNFFDDHLVAMYAIRTDEQRAFRRLQETAPSGPTGSQALRISDPGNNETDGNFNEALLALEDEPFSVSEEDTATWSIVGRYPEQWIGELPWAMDLYGHYYEAESFEPSSGQVNVLNQPLRSPTGTTEEFGFTVELFENRLSVRFNWFETVNANARTDLGGRVDEVIGLIGGFMAEITNAEVSGVPLFPDGWDSDPANRTGDALLTFDTIPSNRVRLTGTDADLIGVDSYDEYYERLINILPPRVQDIVNYQIVTNSEGAVTVFRNPPDGSVQSTMDFVANGMEIDVIGKVTDNLSISLNISQQETVTSNTGPVAITLALEIAQRIEDQGLFNVRTRPFQIAPDTIGPEYDGVIRRLRTEKGKDNTVSPEQREWRVNLVTRYDFLEGNLKGVSVGTGLRYQDEIATGFPNRIDDFGTVIPNTLNPYFGPDELNGDLFFRYGRPIMNGKAHWTLQLNARNLYRKRGDRDIPVNVNVDGTVAFIRIPNEQQYFLTNTVRF